jgi:hypothetical protein
VDFGDRVIGIISKRFSILIAALRYLYVRASLIGNKLAEEVALLLVAMDKSFSCLDFFV